MIEAGEQKQSIPVLTQSVNDLRSGGAKSSAQLARALSALADANLYTGKYAAADELNHQALEIDRSTYGENHPRVAEGLAVWPRHWRFAAVIRRPNRLSAKPWQSWRSGTDQIIRKPRAN